MCTGLNTQWGSLKKKSQESTLLNIGSNQNALKRQSRFIRHAFNEVFVKQKKVCLPVDSTA